MIMDKTRNAEKRRGGANLGSSEEETGEEVFSYNYKQFMFAQLKPEP